MIMTWHRQQLPDGAMCSRSRIAHSHTTELSAIETVQLLASAHHEGLNMCVAPLGSLPSGRWLEV